MQDTLTQSIWYTHTKTLKVPKIVLFGTIIPSPYYDPSGCKHWSVMALTCGGIYFCPEKDQILSLLSSALAKDPVSAYEAPGREQLTVKEVQNLPPASRMALISEEDTTRLVFPTKNWRHCKTPMPNVVYWEDRLLKHFGCFGVNGRWQKLLVDHSKKMMFWNHCTLEVGCTLHSIQPQNQMQPKK